jgi:tRNA threonylcarbamoyl adenosine modification protein (Sua5/YciO/YrdC/YwlC family)
MIIQVNASHPSPYQLDRLVTYLNDDGVLAIPTDTTYALACLPTKKTAVSKLMKLRKLDPKKSLALIFSSIKHVSQHTLLDDLSFRTLKRYLPGPYCFILEANRELPKTIGDKRKRVGVRIPNHPLPIALVEAIGSPLIVTSTVDPDTQVMAHDPWTVEDIFGHGLAAVVDAGLVLGEESTVVDLTTDEPTLLRAGLGDSSSFT